MSNVCVEEAGEAMTAIDPISSVKPPRSSQTLNGFKVAISFQEETVSVEPE